MSQPRNVCGTNYYDPHDQKEINAAKAAEVARVKAALEKPDARRVLLAKHTERAGR